MAIEIRLPNLGQTSDEMTIVEWYKSEGDPIEIAEPLLCVETDKSQVEVESAEEGIVLRIVAQPGDRLESGALLAYVGSPGDEAPSPQAPSRVQALPAVRRLAAELGIDLGEVEGTGPGGRVERGDVERARAAPAGEAGDAVDEAGESHDVSPVRRAIARRLTQSVQTIPQFSVTAQLDARKAQQEIGEYRADDGAKLTYTHLLLRAVARALREHPRMLRVWSDDGPRYDVLTSPDVGLAVAGDESLHVVTIPAPDAGSLPTLVETVASAAGRARAAALRNDDQRPAAITVSNLGRYDVDSFQAIVDPSQTAILAAASVQNRVVAAGDGFAIAPQLSVCLTCDHRTVDGVDAARFLTTVRTYFASDPMGGTR
ncbi:dihydrolipoamide acetyltransferase family protein [Jiangella muralis]|uniref:dihydrolipoamide acetyltransferase family protein n=1 Tax=Jiangella muralis TaxID=702383 RepID=UPI00069E2E2A|nr:dihydrolipoamide acetyltransferase family protein [Jiangella muralis]